MLKIDPNLNPNPITLTPTLTPTPTLPLPLTRRGGVPRLRGRPRRIAPADAAAPGLDLRRGGHAGDCSTNLPTTRLTYRLLY